MTAREADRLQKGIVGGGLIGCVITVPFAFLGILSSGMGHGDYLFARLLFPYGLVWATVVGHIDIGAIVLALLQWPVYGVLIGGLLATRRLKWLVALSIVHFFAFAFAAKRF